MSIADKLSQFLSDLSGLAWGMPLASILLGLGLYFTLRLAFVQVRYFAHAIGVISGKYDDPEHEGDITHFQALCAALSATVGVGNIAGVATAIHYGGPGAVFWMWVSGFFGMATKYATCSLGQVYRKINPDGSASGGPMYYIARGLGGNFLWLAILFAVSTTISSFGGGNMVQANSMTDAFESEFREVLPEPLLRPVTLPILGQETNGTRLLVGVAIAFVVGLVIIGGIKRIGAVAAKLVPLMAILYVGGGLLILVANWERVPDAFRAIFQGAFGDVDGAAWGVGTFAFLNALTWGVKRAVFSNEAGLGSAPMAHAAAKTDEPIREGLVAMLEPFIDTLAICSMTALVVVLFTLDVEASRDEALAAHGYLISAPDGDGSPVGWSELSETQRKKARRAQARYAQGIRSGLDFEARRRLSEEVRRDGVDILFRSELSDGRAVELSFAGLARGANGPDAGGTNPGLTDAERTHLQETLFPLASLNGAPLSKEAFKEGLSMMGPAGRRLGGLIVAVGLILFAVSTAISWSYYGDRCVQFLFGDTLIRPYRWVYVLFLFVGANARLQQVWDFSDVANAFMAFWNIAGVLALSGVLVSLSSEYFRRMREGFPPRSGGRLPS